MEKKGALHIRLSDPKWYLEHNPDVQAAEVEPLSHYLGSGWKEGRNPNPFSNTRWYLESNPAAASLAIDPLQHYCRHGWQQGLSPGPEFDAAWYFKTYQEVAEAGLEPLGEYLSHGSVVGRFPNADSALIAELFDERFYLENNPSVANSGLTPFQHYCTIGWREGRDPNPFFGTRWYLAKNPDLSPLASILWSIIAGTAGKKGAIHTRIFPSSFTTVCIPDLISTPIEPLSHFLATSSSREPLLTSLRLPEFGREPTETSNLIASDVQLIAFYLPQFHEIAENNAWWGEGFTEWVNVRRARQQFPGHYQPHIPDPSIGYYDLTDESVIERQAAMALRFGIHGFCFYHYWFGGKRLLEMPVERMLRTGKPDIPFCLCWANENWTRRWDGRDTEVLISQSHSTRDDELFILDLLRAFRDRRYIRINDQPLLLVYKPELLPDPAATFKVWRDICRREEIGEIFIAGVRSFNFDDQSLGFDALIDFPPHGAFSKSLNNNSFATFPEFSGTLHDYLDAFQASATTPRNLDILYFKGIMPSWDNTARRQENSHVFLNSNPAFYYLWLRHLIRQARATAPEGKRFIFINAWNEWAEGCHLEPDERHGFAWLNATHQALCPVKTTAKSKDSSPNSAFFLSNQGTCPICESRTTFTSRHEWLRDHYLCELCHSIPRERALMEVIRSWFPGWRNMYVHESSPGNRGASAKLSRECRNYVASQYDPSLGFGKIHPTLHYRSEDLEHQTFPDQCFDLVITQDVFEHIFDADAAFREIARTLKPGGAHVFTVPLVNKDRATQRWASRASNGNIIYHGEPEYHGNPVSVDGSLVTWHWGFDIVDRIEEVSGMKSNIVRLDDLDLGISAEYNEVIVSRVI